MRVVLFTGKGGVGKTTTAAATAVHAARAGIKTLVLSTDAAHSLGDALARPLGAVPEEVESGLFAQQIDPLARVRGSWSGVRECVLGLLDQLDVDPVEAEELADLPGAEEVLALLELRDSSVAGPWELVVVDCAPTAETLRLLALPEVLGRFVERLLPMERRLARALAGGIAPLLGHRGGTPVPRDHVVEAAQRLQTELAGVRSLLADPGTSIRLVLTPEAVAVAEALRSWTSLSLYGYVVDGVVVNRLFPDAGADDWRSGWVAAQAGRLAAIEESFGAVPVTRAPYAAVEPVGTDALADLGLEMYGYPGEDALSALLGPVEIQPALRVRWSGREFLLELDLPGACREEVDLSRRGEELVVQHGGRRRAIALPSALRRCRVAGATLRDGVLGVTFTPDPDQWPPS